MTNKRKLILIVFIFLILAIILISNIVLNGKNHIKTTKTSSETTSQNQNNKDSSKTVSSNDIISGIPVQTFERNYNQMKNFIFSGKYQEAYDLAEETMKKTRANGEQIDKLMQIEKFISAGSYDDDEINNILNDIKEPDLYVGMFYLLTPQGQYNTLKDKNQIFIPAKTGENYVVNSITKSGSEESGATHFFSNLDKVDIYKVNIIVNDINYNVYCAYEEGYNMEITKIENGNTTNPTHTTYKDYLSVYNDIPSKN